MKKPGNVLTKTLPSDNAKNEAPAVNNTYDSIPSMSETETEELK